MKQQDNADDRGGRLSFLESVARAYLSVFPSDKGAAMLESINASARTVRYELAQRVRFQLRKTPELTFMLDDSLDYIENIDHLLEK
jgi:ribosome-binding factor A